MTDSEVATSTPIDTPGPGQVVGPNVPGQQLAPSWMMGHVADPVASKLTDDHITSLIDNEETNAARDFWSGVVRTVSLLLVLLIVLGFVFLFTYMFSTSNADLVEKVLIGVVSFAGGIGTGLGANKLLGRLDFE